jgi:hypothetical protein
MASGPATSDEASLNRSLDLIVETAVHATGFDAATVSARSGNGFVSLVASDDPMHTVDLAQYDASARADAGVLHRLADAGC